MRRGIVLKVQGKTAIVLTPDGDFLRAPVDGEDWRPGREVTWVEQPRRICWRPALALACAVVLLLAGSGLAYRDWWALGPAVAYVSVDVNPSLELGVDARERVCSARAFNPEGEKLLAGLAYRRRNLVEVLSALTLRAVQQRYLAAGRPGAVLVTVVPAAVTAEVDPVRLRGEAVGAIRLVLAQKGLEVEVAGWTADRQVREEAGRFHVSAGRMALYLAARRAGVEVTLEEIRREPIARVLSLVGERLERKGPAAPEERDFAQGDEGRHREDDRSPAGPGDKARPAVQHQTGPGQAAGSPQGRPFPGAAEEPSRAGSESVPVLESGAGTVPPPSGQATGETPAEGDDSGSGAIRSPLGPGIHTDDDRDAAVPGIHREEDDGDAAVYPERTSPEQGEDMPPSSDDLRPEGTEEAGR